MRYYTMKHIFIKKKINDLINLNIPNDKISHVEIYQHPRDKKKAFQMDSIDDGRKKFN